MYGRYTSDLGEFAKAEAKRLKLLKRKRKRDDKVRKKEFRKQHRNLYLRRITKGISFLWQNSFAKLGEDWVFLAILGVLMATISFVMDIAIGICNDGKNFIRITIKQVISHFLTPNSFIATLIYDFLLQPECGSCWTWIMTFRFNILHGSFFQYVWSYFPLVLSI